MSRMPLPPASPPSNQYEEPEFPSDDIYERVCQIGQGTFGVVYKARAPDSSMVALKALRLDDQQHGFSVTSVREIQILQKLSHENVISVYDVVASKDAHVDRSSAHVYVVFPYLEHDLSGLLDNPACRLTPSIIKSYFLQIVTAVSYLHQTGILHRDLKCSNILIGDDGVVKLGDFGLARPVRHDQQPYTDKVCTLWYRAPELLLGERRYGPPLDIWSLGCVFAEMLTCRPLFHGSTELDQIDRIFKLCGTPAVLPSSLPSLTATQYPRQFRKVFAKYGAHECDLLDQMLQVDPTKRITADQILQHAYFRTAPLPLRPDQIPKFTPSNELSASQRKKQAAATAAAVTTTPAASSSSSAAKDTTPNRWGRLDGGYSKRPAPSAALSTDRSRPFKRPRSVSPRRPAPSSDSRSSHPTSRNSHHQRHHHHNHHHHTQQQPQQPQQQQHQSRDLASPASSGSSHSRHYRSDHRHGDARSRR